MAGPGPRPGGRARRCPEAGAGPGASRDIPGPGPIMAHLGSRAGPAHPAYPRITPRRGPGLGPHRALGRHGPPRPRARAPGPHKHNSRTSVISRGARGPRASPGPGPRSRSGSQHESGASYRAKKRGMSLEQPTGSRNAVCFPNEFWTLKSTKGD